MDTNQNPESSKSKSPGVSLSKGFKTMVPIIVALITGTAAIIASNKAPTSVPWPTRDTGDINNQPIKLKPFIPKIGDDVANRLHNLMDEADLLRRQKKFTLSESDYRQAVRISPNDARIHSLLGAVLINEERLLEAQKELNLAHKLDPTNEDVIRRQRQLNEILSSRT